MGDLDSMQPMLEALDENKDGYITREEINAVVLAVGGTKSIQVNSVFV